MSIDERCEMDFKVGMPYSFILKFDCFERGNSSVLQLFRTKDDYILRFAAKGTALLFKSLANDIIVINGDGCFCGTFVKRKQGQYYRWEPYNNV